MQPVSLALFWHQHQPYYPDDIGAENLMPWVRLHGTKDYYGMALHIKEVPEFRCTINLVPSLLQQLQAYTEHGATDRHLKVSRMSADDLSEADGCYLLDHFFMASVDNMVRPYLRYHELYLKRGFGVDSAETALSRFNERDLRDLQVWSNLTWIHPIAFELDSDLRAFLEKGHSWTKSEKNWLLDKQLDILKQVVPLHRELMEGGQVELTTTPFYHPIMPLLWNKRSAHQAMGGCPLPRHLDAYREDVGTHLKLAIEYHRELFGREPKGLWPSEGSVSQEILPAIADAGIEWIATDEEILAESTDGWVSRDSSGHMRNPEMLYRPWRVGEGASQMQIVFRDHAMSDLIGFQYQRSDPQHAASDLLGRVESIGRAVESKNDGRAALVPIILDGENCWEYYPDGGVQFLRNLYRDAAGSENIRPVRMSEHIREYPATDRIGQLFAGSWISHNFAIWIGHDEANTAWDHLHETREFLVQTAKTTEIPAETLKKAWEEIYIAEGSDWFWWFGDDHSSAQDGLFDELFRKHLQNVYTILGVPCPNVLTHPISKAETRALHTHPTGFLSVQVDGRQTFFEWISAGRYVSGSERGTMTLVSEGVIREVHFGFDVDCLFIRVDTSRNAAQELAEVDAVVIHFQEPGDTELHVRGWGNAALTATLFRDGPPVADARVEAAVAEILEIAVRFDDLGVPTDSAVHFCVETLVEQKSTDRAPREGSLELTVPSADFEMIMWQV